MIKILDIRLPFQVIAKGDTALMVEVAPVFDYDKDGKRTDKQVGNKYKLVLPNAGYETIVAKVIEDKPVVTNEEIAAKGGAIKVKPKNFEAKFYKTVSGDYALTASASGLEVIV